MQLDHFTCVSTDGITDRQTDKVNPLCCGGYNEINHDMRLVCLS